MKLWLDDIREAPEGWVRARNVSEALDELINGHYPDDDFVEVLSLDHDLGEDEETGYDLLNIIEEMIVSGFWIYPIPEFRIHSANPVGRANMERAINAIARYDERAAMLYRQDAKP